MRRPGSLGYFVQRIFAGLERLRQILGRAVGVHDQHARAAIFFFAEAAQFFEGVNRGLKILRVAVKLAQLLVQDGQRTPPRRQSRRLRLQAGDGIGEHANGIFITALRLVKHGLVVHDLEAAGRVLAGFQEILFRVIELVQFPINLRETQIDVGIVGHQVGKLLVNAERVGEFFFGEQRLAQSAHVAQLGGIQLRGFAVGAFRLRQIVCLRVGIAEKIEQAPGKACGW